MSSSSAAFVDGMSLFGPRSRTLLAKCLPRAHRQGRCGARRLAVTAAAAPKDAELTFRVQEEERKFWNRALQQTTRPSAKGLLERVDAAWALGISPQVLQESKKPPLLEYFKARKEEHPTKLVLVRIGEFYETVGIDAVMLVQHAGLNPMGRGVPRAGCPIINLRRTLRDLVTDAGFSVVVCEEVPEMYSYGSRTKGKDRYVAQILSPGSPNYLVGLVDHEDADVDFERERLIAGVSASVSGHTLVEVDAAMLTYKVFHGQTLEALTSRLQSGFVATPLYVHRYQEGSTSRSPCPMQQSLDMLLQNVGDFRKETGGLEEYVAADPVGGLLDLIRNNLGISEQLTQVLDCEAVSEPCPKPLYLSTACQLGLHATRGMPPLLNYAIGADAPRLARQWMKKLLLLPPPPRVKLALRDACGFLLQCTCALPNFHCVSKHQASQLMRSREANEVFFRELLQVCRAALQCATSPETEKLAATLVTAASHEIGVQLDREELVRSCRSAVDLIEGTIVEKYACDDLDEADVTADDARYMASLRRLNEGFVGKVRKEKFYAEWERVERARCAVEQAAHDLLEAVCKEHPESLDAKRKEAAHISYDLFNNAIWLKPAKGMKASGSLIHPRDRNGALVGNRLSSSELEVAQNEYRASCFAASCAVRDCLRELSAKLSGEGLSSLIGACVVNTVGSALIHHVAHAGMDRGWRLPSEERTSSIRLKKFWPFWLETCEHKTVKNDLDLGCLVLLSGPNMAGKSTVLRSVGALVVLATCGFLVPAESASIPFVDHIMLRNFSSDSPLEGKSGFAVEMHEMRTVLEDVTENSLVLIDELGKGTEMCAGAALAGAILEKLDESECRGIFATHLHALFEMDLWTRRMTEMKMETEQTVIGPKPTLKVAPGRCTESMAMSVARSSGLPQALVDRAQTLYSTMRAGGPQPGAASDKMTQVGVALSGPETTDASVEKLPAYAGSLEEAQVLLKEVISQTLCCEQDLLSSFVISDAEFLRPPPIAVTSSCVYLLYHEDGVFYCGETDNIEKRLKRHKLVSRKRTPRGSKLGTVAVMIPTSFGGKSAARCCESEVIRQLRRRGYKLISDSDAKHSSFAGGGRTQS